jgi:hypothetical protein
MEVRDLKVFDECLRNYRDFARSLKLRLSQSLSLLCLSMVRHDTDLLVLFKSALHSHWRAAVVSGRVRSVNKWILKQALHHLLDPISMVGSSIVDDGKQIKHNQHLHTILAIDTDVVPLDILMDQSIELCRQGVV